MSNLFLRAAWSLLKDLARILLCAIIIVLFIFIGAKYVDLAVLLVGLFMCVLIFLFVCGLFVERMKEIKLQDEKKL